MMIRNPSNLDDAWTDHRSSLGYYADVVVCRGSEGLMPLLHGIGGLLCESELETEGAKFCC